ncbi:MAG: hypothetical protein II948_05100 [Synergistaceae bacterium]|nr:hypothetical protein [Synergistaceae bacterium]MBQ6908758.1 hypothetical protein [Synergistaceae bacterium]MBQ9581510.1 hypothetical protein [Synergistaceae bacterium]MBR0096587.1 hypothetical protein [Synergistaceae bacterium]MBR0222095.1 hypothetical protein [Synergistaceae bacterium]
MQKFIYNSELKLYRSLINAFFTLGGKAWLRRKYKNNIAERMGDIENFDNNLRGCVWCHKVFIADVEQRAYRFLYELEIASMPYIDLF